MDDLMAVRLLVLILMLMLILMLPITQWLFHRSILLVAQLVCLLVLYRA